MTRSLAFVAAVVLLTAAGCGEGDAGDDLSASTSKGGDPVETTTDGEQSVPLSLSLSFTEPLVEGAPATWSLTLTNTAEETVRVVFPTSQRGDVVLTREGSEVYRWSAERVFAQALSEEVLEPGADVTYELDQPSLGVPAGTYHLTAELTGRPPPPPVERTVQVRPA